MGSIDWIEIADLPDALKDGREVRVKRVYEGRVVKDGLAVFDVPASDSPMCVPLGPDPLGRPVDLMADWESAERARVTKRWLNPNRMYAFPEPTHFAELNAPEALGKGGE